MRKIIMIAALLLTCRFTSFSQQCNNDSEERITKETVKELVQRVENLEHNLGYLKSSFDLYKVQTDFSLSLRELQINLNDVKSNIYNENYHYNICRAAEEFYEQMNKKLFSIRMLYETIKDNLEFTSRNKSFTDSEKHMLETSYKMIDATITATYEYLDIYKKTLDIYKEGLK